MTLLYIGLWVTIACQSPGGYSTGSDSILAVSGLVGTKIDAHARRALCLFPGFPGFQSATFFRRPDSSYYVEVRSESGGVEVGHQFPIIREQFRHIADYLNCGADRILALCNDPDGGREYRALWAGIGNWSDPVQPLTEPAEPPRAQWAGQVFDAVSGAAIGAGVGSCVGTVNGAQWIGSRPESTWISNSNLVTSCMSLIVVPPFPDTPTGHWDHYSVDIYGLDNSILNRSAGIGGAVGGAAGYGLGFLDDHVRSKSLPPRSALDLQGNLIREAEIRQRQYADNRVGHTIANVISGSIVGIGIGYLLSSIAHNTVLQNAHADSVELRDFDFAFSIPLVTVSFGTALRLGALGYEMGEQLDRRDAIARIRLERLRAEFR